MFHRILFIIYILMILTVIFIERKSPTEALLWVFIMICLPYTGTILYLVFGSTAAAAGVKIRLMIPRVKASFFLDPVTNYFCGQLLEYGYEKPYGGR